ncbi:hypothetical protein KZJ38_07370 [Paraburkholderia edwinii]|uniref:Uncharacterized protein n=1 Tax=Paraburkholderia edwinii TaxID=2861782 RepID=A0ABX8UT82_9BURK|nr:hypothetical protein [Paraburkholderia edwinii]QYD70120.1 hypothetical protein KZJ38_07370 [Paraburkholderia edwinii]
MEVFRIEDASGKGAYQSDKMPYHPDDGNQPAPWLDRVLGPHWLALMEDGLEQGYQFGFESMDALRAWFHDPDWIRRAVRRGFKLVRYEVPDGSFFDEALDRPVSAVHKGQTQLIFWKSAATRVHVDSLSTIQ